MNKETGGPAFPYTEANGCNNGGPGITIRDYFAAKAMQGLLSDSSLHATYTEFAEEAYMIAEAMLHARG